MSQKVIASRDVDIYINFDVIGVSYKLATGTELTADISGNTDDIGAISTDEPIAVDNNGNTYDLSLTLQQAEALALKDALATATADDEDGAIAHIRQIVEAASISIAWHKKRDVPATTTLETYTKCTGVSENDSVSRRSSETLKNWRWKALGMTRTTVALT